MIFGTIATLLFLFECILFIVNRAAKKKNKILLKAHCIAGFLTVAFSCVHLITVLSVWKQRPLMLNITGIIMLICMIFTCILCTGKRNKVKMRLHRILAVIIIALLCAHIYICISSMISYKNAVRDISINSVDISSIPDGVYQGECDTGYIYASVGVTVSDGKITDIALLEHRNERGESAEEIIKAIISQQNVDVDAISGATNSSKVIKKAVENALISAQK